MGKSVCTTFSYIKAENTIGRGIKMEAHIFAWIMDIFFILTLHILYKQLLGVKHESRWLLLLGWSCWFVLWNLCTYAFAGYFVLNSFCSLLINFGVIGLLYRGAFRSRLILLMVIFVMGMFSEGIVVFLLTFVKESNGMAEAENTYYYLGNALSKIICFLIVKIIALLSQNNKQTKISFTDWLEVFLVPVGSVMICFAVDWESGYQISRGELVIWSVLFVINVSTYYLYQKIQMHTEQAAEKRLLQQQNEYYLAHYLNSRKQWEEVQKIRHDMRNAYVLELGYLEKHQYGLLRKHYENILGGLEYKSVLVDTGNIGIDSILNYKKEVAKERGIRIHISAKIAGEIRIRNEDLNVILGNLLDNAMEAAQELEEKEKEIYLTVKSDKTAMLIDISNKYRGERKKDKQGNYVTGKADKNKHGFGLKAIHEIVKKYRGSMTVKDSNGNFNVQIFLYMHL